MNPTKQEVMSVPVFFFLNSGIDFMIVFSQHLHRVRKKTSDQLIPSVFRRVRVTYVHWVPPKQTRRFSRR